LYGAGHPRRFAFHISDGHFDGLGLVPILKYLTATLQEREIPPVATFAGTTVPYKAGGKDTRPLAKSMLDGSRPLELAREKERELSVTKIINSSPSAPGYV